jgi:diphosphomevalonate decarboxylase
VSNLGRAKAVARANIALAKYWGKCDVALNLPAVPSVSLTLEPLRTETTVTLDRALDRDLLVLGGKAASEGETRRAARLLAGLRERCGETRFARVESVNHFPTASGLASSASGFAALAGAAQAAMGMALRASELSAIARQASASAARSVYGGFVELPEGVPGDGDLAARPLYPPSYWDVRIVVAVADEGPKETGSTDGMEHSRNTSPYYDAWVNAAPGLAEDVKRGLEKRDLTRVGEAMEQSTMAFHACAMASAPGIVYLRPATLAALATVKRLRKDGVPVYATMDAGPHVKALCAAEDAARVASALEETAGVLRTILASPGEGLLVDDAAVRWTRE